MAAANGKPELGQSGGCELARLAASLVRAHVSSARAWVAKTWFAARLREAGYVRGRCVADFVYSGGRGGLCLFGQCAGVCSRGLVSSSTRMRSTGASIRGAKFDMETRLLVEERGSVASALPGFSPAVAA